MPRYTIEIDGHRVTVDAATPDDALATANHWADNRPASSVWGDQITSTAPHAAHMPPSAFVGAGAHAPVQGRPSAGDDIVRSGLSGLVEGARGTVPANGDVMALAGDTAGAILGHLPGFSQQDRQMMSHGARDAMTIARRAGGLPTNAEGVQSGALHAPQTEAGRWAHTGGTMAAGAIGARGPISAIANVAAPTVGSMAAQHAGEALHLPPWARSALEMGGAALGGISAGAATGPTSVQRLIAQNTERMTPADIQATQDAMRTGLNLPNGGVQLAADEAGSVAAPAAATGLRSLAQTAAATPRGAPLAAALLADRPGQVRNATLGVADMIAPPVTDSARLGLRAQGAADQTVRGLEANRTAQVDPLYRAAGPQAPDASATQAALAEAIAKADADQTGLLGGLGDAAEGVNPSWDIENLTRYARNLRDNAMIPAGQPGALARESAGAHSDLANALLEAARRNPDQAAADALYRKISQESVDPALAGPLGEIAPARAPAPPRAADASAAAQTLLPNAPSEGSLPNVMDAARGMNTAEPGVVPDLARTRLVDALNESGQDIQRGPNPMGGASVRANLYGNPEQRAHWQSVLGEFAPSAQQPMDDLMQTLMATGSRGGPSSPTAPLQRAMKDMGGGNALLEALKLDVRPRNIFNAIDSVTENWRLNRNSGQILDYLMSSPEAFGTTTATAQRAAKLPTGAQRALIASLLSAETQGQ